MSDRKSPTVRQFKKLENEVQKQRRKIRTDGYAMSVGEIASLYEDNDIDVRPQFQRFFRWTREQKTNFIESVLLGIPLPQIFVGQREDGVWEIVDGMQRLSTLLEFMGELRDEHRDRKQKSLQLSDATYLPSLKNMTWKDLPVALKRDFRRAKVNVSIVMRGSDTRAKYDLFQRLNTGGAAMSDQEVRNCLLVMENEKFYTWLKELSEIESFTECVAISDRLADEGYHMELASRLLVLSRETDIKKIQKMGSMVTFINENIIDLARVGEDERSRIGKVFTETFSILSEECLGDRVFRRYDSTEDRFKGSFLLSPFEVVGCGIAHNLANGARADDFSKREVLAKIKIMWNDDDFRRFVKSGVSAPSRLRLSIPYGRRKFAIGS